MAVQTVTIEALDAQNEDFAAKVRKLLDQRNVFGMSILGGGGCGKTKLLETTLKLLKDDLSCAVIQGDAFTSLDADRIAKLDVPVVQINTNGGCHLAANMILEVLPTLNLDNIDVLFIENIGNLHYAAKFDLGVHRRATCISVSAGLGLVEKYPRLFEASDVNLITKAELAPYVDFDIPRAVSKLRQLNPAAKVLVTDAVSGDGIDMFCRCVRRELDGIGCV